jgi:hypothetical protein
MKHNVGQADRILRILAGIAMLLSSMLAPVPFAASAALGTIGGYLMLTALAGTCLGYRLMGKSTCPLS